MKDETEGIREVIEDFYKKATASKVESGLYVCPARLKRCVREQAKEIEDLEARNKKATDEIFEMGKEVNALEKQNKALVAKNKQFAKESKERFKVMEGVGYALGMKYPSENRKEIIPKVKELEKQNKALVDFIGKVAECESEGFDDTLTLLAKEAKELLPPAEGKEDYSKNNPYHGEHGTNGGVEPHCGACGNNVQTKLIAEGKEEEICKTECPSYPDDCEMQQKHGECALEKSKQIKED